MNPILSKLLVDIARKKLKSKQPDTPLTKKQIEPVVNNLSVELKHTVKEYIFIIIGVFSAGFGLKGFLLPNRFIDGGATGISLLLENITNIELGYLLILVNLPFIILATQTINLKFAIRSIIAIAFLAVVVHFVDYPIITRRQITNSCFWWILFRFRNWNVHERRQCYRRYRSFSHIFK